MEKSWLEVKMECASRIAAGMVASEDRSTMTDAALKDIAALSMKLAGFLINFAQYGKHEKPKA